MILALFAHALADDKAPSAMDIQDCGSSIDRLYPADGSADVALDTVPMVTVASPECGGMALDLVLLADGEIVAQRSVDSNDAWIELEGGLEPHTEYQFLVYESGRDTTTHTSSFATGGRLESPAVATPDIARGTAVMYDEGGVVYLSVTVSAVPEATIIGLAAWDGENEPDKPGDVADAATQANLTATMLDLQVGEEACVGAMARGLDGRWSTAATECFVVTQGWEDEEEWEDDHDHACNAASAAIGLFPICLGTLGILRRRAR